MVGNKYGRQCKRSTYIYGIPASQVCELDIIFNFEKAYFILDEFLLGGEPQETSKKNVLKAIEQADLLQEVKMFSHVDSFRLSNSKGNRHVDGLAFSNLLWLPSAVYFQVCHASMINLSLSLNLRRARAICCQQNCCTAIYL